MKVVDYFTGKLVIIAYNESNNYDIGFYSPTCDYMVLTANEYLLKVLREIKNFKIKYNKHLGSNFNSTNINSIEFSFDDQVDFFGEGYKKKEWSEFYSSIINSKREDINFYQVCIEEDGYEAFIDTICGRIRQTEDGDRPVIVYDSELDNIYFKFNPDIRNDYRTNPIKIDELIEYLEKNLENK
jgi:hypothetical protein